MLFITVLDLKDGMIYDKEWHLGEQVPNIDHLELLTIQADGDELYYILSQHSDLLKDFRSKERRVMQWSNAVAKHIFRVLEGR